ncbi:hypothetical protein L1275_003194 [Flavobacterium sp. HSC-61S13]|nr:hypothetical protein [Flavobacterium sp. HSC-61S13]
MEFNMDNKIYNQTINTATNKGLAIASGKHKVHVLYFDLPAIAKPRNASYNCKTT